MTEVSCGCQDRDEIRLCSRRCVRVWR